MNPQVKVGLVAALIVVVGFSIYFMSSRSANSGKQKPFDVPAEVAGGQPAAEKSAAPRSQPLKTNPARPVATPPTAAAPSLTGPGAPTGALATGGSSAGGVAPPTPSGTGVATPSAGGPTLPPAIANNPPKAPAESPLGEVMDRGGSRASDTPTGGISPIAGTGAERSPNAGAGAPPATAASAAAPAGAMPGGDLSVLTPTTPPPPVRAATPTAVEDVAAGGPTTTIPPARPPQAEEPLTPTGGATRTATPTPRTPTPRDEKASALTGLTPTGDPRAPARDARPGENGPSGRAPVAGGETYTIQEGDTLSAIASDHYGEERFWAKIAAANPGVDPNRLVVGKTLTLPAKDAAPGVKKPGAVERNPAAVASPGAAAREGASAGRGAVRDDRTARDARAPNDPRSVQDTRSGGDNRTERNGGRANDRISGQPNGGAAALRTASDSQPKSAAEAQPVGRSSAPVTVAASPNGTTSRENGMPSLDDLSGSGSGRNSRPADAGPRRAADPASPRAADTRSVAVRSGVHVVGDGDSLASIAQERLGNRERWREIWDLNKDRVKNPDRLLVGTQLRLPTNGERAKPSADEKRPSGRRSQAAPRVEPAKSGSPRRS